MSSQCLHEDWPGITARLRLEGCQQALRHALTGSQLRRGRGLEMLSSTTALKLLHSLICMLGVEWCHWWPPLPGREPWERLVWAAKLPAEPKITAASWALGLSCHRVGEFGMGGFGALLWVSWL